MSVESLQQLITVVPRIPESTLEKIKAGVEDKIKLKIGPEPKRKQVKKDQGNLFGLEDWLAIVVFLASFFISSIHILSMVSQIASDIIAQEQAAEAAIELSGVDHTEYMGIEIEPSTFIKAHQVGFALLAEFAMILFMVRWRLESKRKREIAIQNGQNISAWYNIRQMFNINFFLAMIAVIFTLRANLTSNLPPLEAIMPPLFTIGIGTYLEGIFVEVKLRAKELDVMYRERLDTWKNGMAHIHQHPDYERILIKDVWSELRRSLPEVGIKETQLTPPWKWELVKRELNSDRWYDGRSLVVQSHATLPALPVPEHPNDESQGLKKSLRTSALKADVIRDMAPDIESVYTMIEDDIEGKGVFTSGELHANMDEMTWYNPINKKTYGPYKTKGTMLAAMRSAFKIVE